VFFFQAEDGIRDPLVTGVQTCALPIWFHVPLVPEQRAPPVARPRPAPAAADRVDAEALAAWLRPRLDGEVRFDAGSRALYATDRSEERRVGKACGARWAVGRHSEEGSG